jgi:integrase
MSHGTFRMARVDSEYVFYSRDGEAYKRVDRAFNSARDRAGIPKTHTFHCLRHTFATWSLTAGKPIHTVAKILGHSTTRVTELYGHLMKDTAHDVVNSLPVLVSATL